MKNQYLVYIILGSFIIVSISIGFFIGLEQGKKFKAVSLENDFLKKMEQQIKDNQEKKQNITDNNQAIDKEKIPFAFKSSGVKASEIIWQKPVKLGALPLFRKNMYEEFGADPEYYEIAKIKSGGTIILGLINQLGTIAHRFIAKDNQYFYLDDPADYKDLNLELKNQIFIEPNSKIILSDLNPPDILKVNNIRFKRITPFMSDSFFSEIIDNFSYQKIGETQYGEFYVIKKELDLKSIDNIKPQTKITSIQYVVKLVDSTVIFYEIEKDFFADDGTLLADLSDNDFTGRRFNVGFAVGGCGRGTDNQAVSLKNIDSLTQIGVVKTSKSPLYTVKNKQDDLLKIAYHTYKMGREEQEEGFLSLEEFAAKKPLLIWQDPLGNYLVFLDADYDALAECAKPVIYLYPEKTTKVSVKVGADIAKSEPLYDNGWEITAYPDGTLIDKSGKKWNYLFWDGQGQGIYPMINSGRVVKRANIQEEITKDLLQIGLNEKEINDFLEFWLPHMPTTPYIRITWLETKQMNILAPLKITPKPDTLIRVFLDFAGQNSPETTLKQQQLSSYQRRGFTVVEWGGLLIRK